MEGKTINKIKKVETPMGDEALLFEMTDGSIYVVESGSSYSEGIISYREVEAFFKDSYN